MMKWVVLGSALVLTACNSFSGTLEEISVANERNIGICPNVYALSEAARLVEFNGEPSLETVAWSGEITDVRSSCRYVGDRPIDAVVEIDFHIGRGPAALENSTDIGYFVAVTRRNEALIAKAEYSVPVSIRNNVATVRFTEDIEEILIPRADETTSGGNFEIAVGFVLSREQLLFNRSGDSLKFPEIE